MRPLVGIAAVLTVLGDISPARADEAECYDVKVSGKAIAQVPTAYPDDPGYIVIGWPWFVDLKVKKVIDGELAEKRVSALAVLHSSYVSKTRMWLLRRNSLGGFNILRVEESDKLGRCAIGVKPARPYLLPAEGETLDDYRREGERLLREDSTDYSE